MFRYVVKTFELYLRLFWRVITRMTVLWYYEGFNKKNLTTREKKERERVLDRVLDRESSILVLSSR